MHVPPRLIHIVVVALLASLGSSAASQSAPAGPFRLMEATIEDVREGLASGQITCRQLVQMYLDRIAAFDDTGPALNAVQTVNPRALDEADALDGAWRTSGARGPLHCIPTLVKDQVETRDMPTSYGSALFREFVPERDATVVKRLRSAGALILGKTTMGEFANSYIGSAFGVVRNAYDPRRTASGSSGGTGASIAANFAMVGIAEDTGGSTRGPAAFGSLVGLRPSVPLVSRHGVFPATPTRDTIGPIARTVRDAAIVLDAIAGYDPDDAITAYAFGQVPPSYAALLDAEALKGARLGIVRQPMSATTDPSSEDYKKVRVVTDRALADLARLGARLVDPLPVPQRQAEPRAESGAEKPPRRVTVLGATSAGSFETEQAIDAYLALHKNAPARTLREILLSGKVAPRRARELMAAVGRSTSDPAYLQTLLDAEAARRAWLKVMADYQLDAIVYATFDHQPTVIPDDVLTNPAAKDEYGRGSNRSLSPTLGFPAITVPAGFTSDRLPVGLEFLGRPFAEATLLRLAFAYEQGTRRREPPSHTPSLRLD